MDFLERETVKQIISKNSHLPIQEIKKLAKSKVPNITTDDIIELILEHNKKQRTKKDIGFER